MFQRPSLEGNNEEVEDSVGESGSIGCGCQHCSGQPRNKMLSRFQGYDEIDPEKHQMPANEEFFFLCDDKISGLLLKSRTWGTQAVFFLTSFFLEDF